MIDETIGNINFLKETIGKFKNEVQKFIADPNYVNHNVVNLRQSLDDLEKNILNKEKHIAGQILNNNKTLFNSVINHQTNEDQKSTLPNIYRDKEYNNNRTARINSKDQNYTYNSLVFVKRSKSKAYENSNSNFNLKSQSDSKFYGGEEREVFREITLNRRPKDPIKEMIDRRKMIYEKKKRTAEALKNYGLITDRSEAKAKRSAGGGKFMDRSKLLQYSNLARNYYQGVLYDENNRPIVTREEVNKGMLNLIYKGLVPKTADLTPAFNKEGNPLNLTNKVREIYGKSKLRDEIDTDSGYMKIEQGENNSSLFITVAQPNGGQAPKEIQETQREDESHTLYVHTDKSRNHPKEEEDTLAKLEREEKEKEKSSPERTDLMDTEAQEKIIQDYMITNKNILLFSNFRIVFNEDYIKFKAKNEERWGIISYLIEHLQKLFKKLNYPIIEVDGFKLATLASDELRTFTIKDFLSCITDKDLHTKGLDLNNYKSLSANIRDTLVIRIQNCIRIFLSKKKASGYREKLRKVQKIQRCYRLFKLIHESRELLAEKFTEDYAQWKEMMKEFKAAWKETKSSRRLEIHLNSLSYSHYKNSTIEKFAEKENNQISRIIALVDPNVEIVHVSPFRLGNEILSYYFSILQTLGVENAKDRFHVVVPEIKDQIAPTFSLTQMLFFSNTSIKKIKSLIRIRGYNRLNTYIVPGTISKSDLDLSMYMNIPILMDDFEMMQAIFTKSGAKRIFELTNMASPISAWDIKTEEEFFKSLTHLVKNYITINIWVFKIDNEHGGRGIAYVALDKIKSFVELKKDRLNNVILDDNKFEGDLRFILRKAIPKKAEIITNKLFRGWDEFFTEFCTQGGVIEACPTAVLSGIIGSPAVAMFIEPDGNVECICSFDKLNTLNFRSFGYTSPQQSIPNLVSPSY